MKPGSQSKGSNADEDEEEEDEEDNDDNDEEDDDDEDEKDNDERADVQEEETNNEDTKSFRSSSSSVLKSSSTGCSSDGAFHTHDTFNFLSIKSRTTRSRKSEGSVGPGSLPHTRYPAQSITNRPLSHIGTLEEDTIFGGGVLERQTFVSQRGGGRNQQLEKTCATSFPTPETASRISSCFVSCRQYTLTKPPERANSSNSHWGIC